MIKAIETEYKGYKFRSRLEARWAIFFDAIGVRWEYEPEGYETEDGTRYLPDFLIHDVCGQVNDKLWIEVKGETTEQDFVKIRDFVFRKEIEYSVPVYREIENPLFVVGNIPKYDSYYGMLHSIHDLSFKTPITDLRFKMGTVTGCKPFTALPTLLSNGKLYLVEMGLNYDAPKDEGICYAKTCVAYELARQARFEHGETPTYEQIRKRMEEYD